MRHSEIVLTSKENIRVSGHRGKWYVIDEIMYNNHHLYLLEHQTYGDEAACVIISPTETEEDDKGIKFIPLLEDVWNGFDDMFEDIEVNPMNYVWNDED